MLNHTKLRRMFGRAAAHAMAKQGPCGCGSCDAVRSALRGSRRGRRNMRNALFARVLRETVASRRAQRNAQLGKAA